MEILKHIFLPNPRLRKRKVRILLTITVSKPWNENNIRNNFITQKETNSKGGVKSGEEKGIKRTRNKGRTRIYDGQPKTNTEHVRKRLGLISKKSKTENLFQNKSGGRQHVTKNKYAFSAENTKNRERVQNKDDYSNSIDIEIDLTKFRSNGDETEVTKTEAELSESLRQTGL